MAKRKRDTTPAVIDRRLEQGRGKGTGKAYKPWLHIQDVPSLGLVQRIKGWKTGRVHHLLSQLEAAYFYVLEWSPKVLDIREQYPLLPLEETLSLAKQCGVRHPTDPKTKQPIVMTADFLITLQAVPRSIEQVRTIKLAAELQKRRVREKFEIERRYWRKRNIDFGIVTERVIPFTVARNVELLHPYFDITDRLNGYTEYLPNIIATLAELIFNEPDRPLRNLSRINDQQLALSPGTSLAIVYHLLATQYWRVDLTEPVNPDKPLKIIEFWDKSDDIND